MGTVLINVLCVILRIMTMKLTDELRKEYQRLFLTMQPKQAKALEISIAVKAIKANKARYLTVQQKLGIPWLFIAVIHNMECSRRFDKHLHNGDPLTARTINVPAGRPKKGNPPFTWEESAIDALTYMNLHKWTDWTIPGMLYKLEAYNGFGYRRNHPEVLSPYLWSFSNHYTSGKYVADGRWSDSAISNQCGAAVILKELIEVDNNYLAETAEMPAKAAEEIKKV
jgi:lysozyme family protein